MLSGPTSAKKPILFTLVTSASMTSPLNCVSVKTYRLEHDGLVFAAELGEAGAGHDAPLPDVHDRYDLDNVPLREWDARPTYVFPGAGPFDVVLQLARH